MKPLIQRLAFLLISLSLWSHYVSAKSMDDYLQQLSQDNLSSFVTEKAGSAEPIDIQGSVPRVPASTLKIVTAYLALKRWGSDHRFYTDFYQVGNTLWVKGYGDPFITSQEMSLIAKKLRPKLNAKIKRIALDNRYFPELKLDGRGSSNNPYDAGNAALVVNFNTLNLIRNGAGVFSGEPQTPLTPLSIRLAHKMKPGKRRISLPGGRDTSTRYFGELLSQKLLSRQVSLKIAALPAKTPLLYRHQSSKSLEQVLLSMLRYSNNFIANQLFLLLPESQEQVDTNRAQQWYTQSLIEEFSWENVWFEDGAGLSRKNNISATQLLELLKAFKPWIGLLPSRIKDVKAKTGTLSDNHSYAGYFLDDAEQWRAFVLLVNQKMPSNYRFNLAKALQKSR